MKNMNGQTGEETMRISRRYKQSNLCFAEYDPLVANAQKTLDTLALVIGYAKVGLIANQHGKQVKLEQIIKIAQEALAV